MSQRNNSGAARSTNGSKRSKYVSKACEPCRQRRAKCDGQRPICSACVVRSIDCQYSTASDGRRPASKSYVQLLRERIGILECILRAHAIDVDTAVAQYHAEHASPSSQHADGSNTTSKQLDEICAAFEGTLSLDESVNFDDDGEAHYFGPTSGRLCFQDLEKQSCHHYLVPQIASRNFKTNLCHPGPLGAQPNAPILDIDADLQAELIDLYFIWQNPWIPVLDESMFRSGYQQGSGRFFSQLLLSCVLAAGCRFSDRVELRTDPNDPETAGKQFLEQAEILLHYELKFPSLTTIQAAAIMIIVYCGEGSDAVAWLYQGTAHRLALDMGLNFDVSSIPGSNCVSVEEANLRRQIYWSLYCTDKLHASYSGRVCTMLNMQGAVKLPHLTMREESIDGSNLRSQRTTTLLCAQVTQNQILEKILLGFYAPQPSHAGCRGEPFFNSTLVELKNWLYDLPDELRLEAGKQANTFPQVYTLHMSFHTVLILLGNALLAGNAHATPGEANNNVGLDKKASCICYEAATNICVIAQKYKKAFGSFRRSPITATHCLLSASLILLQVASNETDAPRRKAAAANVDLCLASLEELSVSWSPAGRIHCNLTLLKAQKLGGGTRAKDWQQDGPIPLVPALPAPDAVPGSNAALLDSIDLADHDFTSAVLLNDTHSFLESYANGDDAVDGLDFTAQLADPSSSDPFLWGNFGMMDFSPNFDEF